MNFGAPSIYGLIISILLPFVSGAIAWLMADGRSNTRLEIAVKSLTEDRDRIIEMQAVGLSRLLALETALARSTQDREELHRWVERLENNKASRDVVEAIRDDVATFRQEMNNRFDRLERTLDNHKV